MEILSSVQETILKHERIALGDLKIALVRFKADEDDFRALSDSIVQLDELFLLVVVGEFNAGKSAFINALLGEQLMPEGVTPTTTQINILRFGEKLSKSMLNENQLLQTFPVDWLSEISIVDTPGTNAIIRTHEEITDDFIPRSDLVLFVTSADRPYTESERIFLEKIRDWGKKIVVVINKVDILRNEAEIQEVIEFVAENGRILLGRVPEIFPVSSRLALMAKQGNPELWPKSQFESLEVYIRNTLDEKSRLRYKLLNPLGVGIHLSERYLSIIENRLFTLRDDAQMLDDVESQLGIYKEDMSRDFNYRMADIENLLFGMEKRGLEYFDNTFRLARFFDLLSKDRIRAQFEETVVGDVPNKIEIKVNEIIDWLVEADLRQWHTVNEHLIQRRKSYQDRIIGDFGPGNFVYDRERLIEAVGKEAQRVVDTYNKETEALKIANHAQEAVAASAVLEVGAIGLGALVAVLASTVAADVTGILMATFIAALGLIIIPARRKIAKTELSAKIKVLRDQLAGTLREQFQKEIDRSIMGIQDAISPYTRFVRSEQKSLYEMRDTLKDIQLQFIRLKNDIETELPE